MAILTVHHSLPFALLIVPFERVVRSDGTTIVTAETLSTKQELRRIAKTVTSRLILLSSLWALWSFFYRYDQTSSISKVPKYQGRKISNKRDSGSWSTYLGIYFSVRARALSSLVSPFFCM